MNSMDLALKAVKNPLIPVSNKTDLMDNGNEDEVYSIESLPFELFHSISELERDCFG